MFSIGSKQKKLKMIWQVQKNGKLSQIVGTAHFFPYSFRKSLYRCIENARLVMFEGPLDDQNMARVRESGIDPDSTYHLFDELDDETIAGITAALIPICRIRNSTHFYHFHKDSLKQTVYDLVKGMQPWLAFLRFGPIICSVTAGNIRSIWKGSALLKNWAKRYYFLKPLKSKSTC